MAICVTCLLYTSKIPVKNPWEIFAYLPFGNWNECPDTQDLMAVAKYWFEQHGAIPAAMSHDELEVLLPAPVPDVYKRQSSFNDLPSMRGNHDYIFGFLKSVCYAFGHLYGKREGIRCV